MTTGTLCAAQPTRNKPNTKVRNRNLHIDRTNAERQRRYRMRQRNELCPARVEVNYRLIVRLVELGYLQDGQSLDPSHRARAIEKFLSDNIQI